MARTFEGIIVSAKMNNSAVVEVTRRIPHPKYKKLLKRSKKFLTALNGHEVKVGQAVLITETRPVSKTIHFMITKVHTSVSK